MGASSSANKGVASRSRYSSWGSSIDEAICGENALCGDYPDDDVEGFPLFSQAPSRRASVVTNPYIEATPRRPPKLRRAFSEGEASVRRAYTTDYSDNDSDPDTDDEFPEQPNMIRKSRSALMLHNEADDDDFPNHPVMMPVTTTRYDSALPPRSRAKRRRKKASNRAIEDDRRRPFSPSQMHNAPLQKLPKKKNRRSSMPRPESDYQQTRRYSLPETIPITSHSRRYSAFETDKDPFGNVETPLYSQPTRKSKKPKKKAKSTSSVPKDDPDWLTDYHLPSQVPSDTYRRSSQMPDSHYAAPLKPIKPITKTRQYDKEPNYKVPTSQPRTRKRSQPKKSTKKIPSYPLPQYSGLPTQYDSVLQAAPPVRKGARIRAPIGRTSNGAPTPFVVGKTRPPKTPYLVSNDEIGYNYI